MCDVVGGSAVVELAVKAVLQRKFHDRAGINAHLWLALTVPAEVAMAKVVQPMDLVHVDSLNSMTHPLLRPKALVGHLLVLAVAGTCIALGQWQLSRLADVRAANLQFESRLAAPELNLEDLVAAARPGPGQTWRDVLSADDLAGIEYRRVQVSGQFRLEDEVLQRNREYRTQSGFHLLTPLESTNGTVVLVRRGWVPSTMSQPPVSEALPPTGAVTVTGILELPVSQPSFGPTDPENGRLERVFHTDTARLDSQIAGDLFPMVLRLESQLPPADDDAWPLTLDPLTFDEANHLSYAVQWNIFAVLALGTYGAWLFSQRRQPGTAD